MALNYQEGAAHGHPVWDGDSFADYKAFLKEISQHDRLLFRGQASDWPLLPSIARLALGKRLRSAEIEMMKRFKDKAEKYLAEVPSNEWDWLALAQHYGLPTRLLDWSKDPQIALWFAVKAAPPEASNRKWKPEVWAFWPDSEDVIDLLPNHDPYSGKRTKAFTSPNWFPRAAVQEAAFTVFKYMPEFPDRFVVLNRNKLLRRKLARFRLPYYVASECKTVLNRSGINHENLFLDLDMACRKLKAAYKMKDDRNSQ